MRRSHDGAPCRTDRLELLQRPFGAGDEAAQVVRQQRHAGRRRIALIHQRIDAGAGQAHQVGLLGLGDAGRAGDDVFGAW
jgi:hypothetical protein